MKHRQIDREKTNSKLGVIEKLLNPNNDSDFQKLQKTMFEHLWKDNREIEDIKMGKHDDVFDEEDKKEIIQMIEQDNFEMRKQRILSGIRKDKKNNYKVLKEIFGVEGITIQ